MTRPLLPIPFLLCVELVHAEVAGRIRDAHTGEPLAKARISLGPATAITAADGRFRLPDSPFGQLLVSLVGYRSLQVTVASPSEFDLLLTPDGLTRRESVEVRENVFEPQFASSASERTLSSAEIRNLAGVITNDPLRAVQGLPGVAWSNDFTATFAVRGAAFQRVGIFLDGVMLNNPLHATQGAQASGSLSMMNTDIVESLTLHAGAPPVQYMDRNASTLDMTIREGSDKGIAWRVNTGVAATSAVAEGPWRKGTWLVSARKSYLQYLLERARAIDTLAFGFFDVQAKATHRLSSRQQASLTFFDGISSLDRTGVRANLGINAILEGSYHLSNVQLGHRWTPAGRVSLANKISWLRERADNRNPQRLPLTLASYGEWIANSDFAWSGLRAGASFRRQREDGFEARYQFNPLALRRRDAWLGRALRAGAYLEHSFARGPWSATAGARWDDSSTAQPAAFSPHASLRVRLGRATQWISAASQAVQYVPLSQLTIANTGNPNLLPSRSVHAITGIEQTLGPALRLRAEGYYRADRDLVAQPLFDVRLLDNGRLFLPPASPRLENSVRGAARGFEIFLQKRSANRWNGWASYGWSRTRLRDGITRAHYDADTDQRHTINVYASYRLSASVNLSLRYSFGSNFPVPGFFEERNGQYFVSRLRNTARLPVFQRADFRLNKQFERKRWRGVLFVEVMNLWNANNRTFDSYNGFNPSTGRANISLLRLFPIVPAAGWMMDWGHR